MTHNVSEEFGSLTFNERVMQEKLPKSTYQELMKVVRDGEPLNLDIANEVAHAMKEWALEKGATHYAHWFQPLTGITSEKHDSFLTPQGNGTSLMTFSGKELVQGEPDASSFPSGGLRATFEARGYTAWDPLSPAFIKDEVLCIPTAFISYRGEALDKKTPLLRSLNAIDTQVKRLLALFGKHPKKITVNIGPEQEYFLITEEDYKARPDLILTGRTLFGSKPAKGQELEEHYFGAIRPSVNAFMKEIDSELWKLGVPVKTKHNEVAPCQHELAPIYEEASVAIDDNLLTMEKLRLLATKYGFACLEAEKPFEYVNGSGKHNNWSISADGENLLEPTSTPEDNLQFLVIMTCIIAAIDEHAGLLRASVASAGNDHRLGANEAPPAIVSIFLGEQIEGVVDAIINDNDYTSKKRKVMTLGVDQVADVVRDNTDRNRTSPFAFTGNKFELRMCGSQQNLSDPNVVLNVIACEQFDAFVEAMEGVSENDFHDAALAWVKKTLTAHRRIIFSGDGYSEEWPAEAARRGLPNLRTTPDALPELISPKSVEVFEKYGVLSETEVTARYIAKAEQYSKLLNIEANTMIYMVRHMYLPALFNYSGDVAATVAAKAEIGIEATTEKKLVADLTSGIDAISAALAELVRLNDAADGIADPQAKDEDYRDNVIPAMEKLRAVVDEMELLCGHDYWPVPSYNRMLFYV